MITKNSNLFLLFFLTVSMVTGPGPLSSAETEMPPQETDAASQPSADKEEAVQSDVVEPISVETIDAPAQSAVETDAPPAPVKVPSQPRIAVRMLGSEFNIQVLYDHPMNHADNDYIESIQMETVKGDFLGLSTFGPNATEAYAEFMVNPKLADFNEVVIIAKSTKEGEIRTPLKLELTKETELLRAGQPAEQKRPAGKTQEVKEKKEKKDKKFLLF